MAPSAGKLGLVPRLDQGLEGKGILDKYKLMKTRAGEETVPSVEPRTKIFTGSELQ